MNGDLLALGTVAAIAAVGLARRRGGAAFDLDAAIARAKSGESSPDWSDRLDARAKQAMTLFGSDDSHQRAIDVAYAVGAEAVRLGVSEQQVGRWLQTRYGQVWVMLGRLDPGADLSEVRQAVFKAMRLREG